jgi:hypothetical protein
MRRLPHDIQERIARGMPEGQTTAARDSSWTSACEGWIIAG